MAWSWIQSADQFVSDYITRRCHNSADFRRAAQRRLPAPMFHYLDGAADDEVTLRRSERDFDELELYPRYLVDVSAVDAGTTVMGQAIDFPVVLAPTGMSRLFHYAGELAVARAASAANTIYSLSTVSTYSIEDVAAVCAGPKWFQIYVFKDRGLVTEFIERCRAAQYHALVLTIDLPLPGNRERDLRTGMTIPPKFTTKSWLDFALHPLWSLCNFSSDPFVLANVVHRVEPDRNKDVVTLAEYIGKQFDCSVTWDDAAAMVQEWGGPFAVKGILTAADAKRAVEIGAHAVIVSTHGGRQLDHVPSPLAVLPEIVAAVDGRAEVILDGGVRRGTDVIKALARGARACMIGRAYLYPLGAGGERGVAAALAQLHREIVRDMALLGTPRIEDICSDYVRSRTRI